jgi:carbon-monoxide dehydrogenase medium subunit/6-hydroxypseudooxynicotine dehydrogenase subunit alpha
MKLPAFALTRAESLDHALAVLGELGSDAKPLAGGQSLIPLMSFRLASPAHLVDVSELAELRFVAPAGAGLQVGGTTRHSELEAATRDAPPRWRAIAEAVPLIGHLPIRTRGTIGGSLAHADATAELPLLAQTLDAVIVAQSQAARREVAAAAFFRGTMSTSLEATELIVEIRFPAPPAGAVSVFEEFSERAGDFALASVCAAAACEDAGICTWARVGVGAVAPTPIRSAAAEGELLGSRLDGAAIEAACAALARDVRPRAGLHVTAEFRGELTATLLRRALGRLARELERSRTSGR